MNKLYRCTFFAAVVAGLMAFASISHAGAAPPGFSVFDQAPAAVATPYDVAVPDVIASEPAPVAQVSRAANAAVPTFTPCLVTTLETRGLSSRMRSMGNFSPHTSG